MAVSLMQGVYSHLFNARYSNGRAVPSYSWEGGVPLIPWLIDNAHLGYDEDNRPYSKGWVFSSDYRMAPSRDVDGTGMCSIVFSSYQNWAISNKHNSASFPILRIHIFADSSRNLNGSVIKQDAQDKAKFIYSIIHPLFHDPGNKIFTFGDYRIVSTTEGEAFSVVPVNDVHEDTVRGLAAYDLVTFQ